MPSPVKTTAVVLAMAALPLTTPGAAHAAASISCRLGGAAEFSPGVQAFTQEHQVFYLGDERDCIDHSDLGIASARLLAGFGDVDLSCLARNVGAGTGWAAIEWNVDGTPLISDLDLTVEKTSVNTATVTGVVLKGPFRGQRFTGHIETELLGPGGECEHGAAADGVGAAGFRGEFSIG